MSEVIFATQPTTLKKSVECYRIDIVKTNANQIKVTEPYVSRFSDKTAFEEFLKEHLDFHKQRALERNFTLKIITYYETHSFDCSEKKREYNAKRKEILTDFHELTGIKFINVIRNSRKLSELPMCYVETIPVFLQKLNNLRNDYLREN